MANLKINNYHDERLRINLDEYWDFYVNRDSYGNGNALSTDDSLCLISDIDLEDYACKYDDGWVYSKSVWDDAISEDKTLTNISYTGFDNGLFLFRKDRISNKQFTEIFQGQKYELSASDRRLKLHAVSGCTLQYDYPLHMEQGWSVLNGGFYQGFFRTECGKYEVLPSNFESGDNINFEFRLKRCDLEKESDRTLNDKYPENKGIFFYIGTRAENKWIYEYDKEDQDGLESCFQLGMDDYVEGGEIDKDDYIIGNFYDPNPDFDGYNPFDGYMDDYTDYDLYDESLYESDMCEVDFGLEDYVEIPSKKKAKLIDETLPHTNIGNCCNWSGEDGDFVLRPFFQGCLCPVRYKRERRPEGSKTSNSLNGCDEFGDGYVVDYDDIMSVEEAREYIEPELDITHFIYYTDNGLSMFDANQYYFYTDNKFMMFDRTKTGKTVRNWVEGTEFMYYGRRSKFKGNLFILMNRTKTGYTISDIEELMEEDANEYDPYNDLYNNALAFRITDDGAIGYRYLTINCDAEGRDKTTIIENYSNNGVVPYCEWTVINVRIAFSLGKMKLMFYVDGKLRHISQWLPALELRKLNDLYEKQEGVPYNVSLGGGTQGLAETILRNYMLNPTRVYPLEKYFAGSFIGYISHFKIRYCLLGVDKILKNFRKYFY